MSERVHGKTMEILERIAAGHSVQSIADSLGTSLANVWAAQRRHPDLLNKIKHQKADGSPDAFPPGYGCESIKRIEQPVETPVEKPTPEPPRHSFAELFGKINRLEIRNKELEEKLHEKNQNTYNQTDLLAFMVRHTLAEGTTKEELMGIASTVDFLLNAEAIKEAVNNIYEFEV